MLQTIKRNTDNNTSTFNDAQLCIRGILFFIRSIFLQIVTQYFVTLCLISIMRLAQQTYICVCSKFTIRCIRHCFSEPPFCQISETCFV
jgi:hypothetical protein